MPPLQESKSSATHLYASTCVVRSSHAADTAVLPNGIPLLAYATHRRVAVSYDAHCENLATHALLEKLPSPITTLKISSSGTALLLLAATADGRLAAWRSSISTTTTSQAETLPAIASQVSWTLLDITPKATGGPVRGLAALRPHDSPSSSSAQVITTHADGIVRVWVVSESIELKQEFRLDEDKRLAKKGAMPLDAALCRIGEHRGARVLAIATTDSRIALWGAESAEAPFTPLCSLAGHEDWVRSLDFTTPNPSTLLLASGAQDGTVRLWRFTPSLAPFAQPKTSRELTSEDDFDALAARLEGNVRSRVQDLVTAAQSFTLGLKAHEQQKWDVRLDALLAAHDNWVTGVRWAPPSSPPTSSEISQEKASIAALLSASADNSAILWCPASALANSPNDPLPLFREVESNTQVYEGETELTWMPLQRFGDLGNQGSVALGLMGALWLGEQREAGGVEMGKAIVAHGWNGALRLWSVQEGKWLGRPTGSGHFAAVRSARWEPQGRYFVTGGADKTTRIHGPCRAASGPPAQRRTTWHEIARPQTHGHEVHCVGWLDALTLASAAEEKVVRVFEAPFGFVESVVGLGSVSVGSEEEETSSTEEEKETKPKQEEKEEKTYDVLAFNLPTLPHIRSPSHLGAPIRHAIQIATSSSRRLVILIASPLFDALHTGAPLGISFADAETLLKWTYAQAWSWCVENAKLNAEVDVLFCGLDRAPVVLRALADESKAERFWVVKESSATLPFLFAQRPRPGALAPEGLRPSCTALSQSSENAEAKADSGPCPQHRVVALGGTFDHLHVGHKILLSMASLLATERIIVGVTDDTMLKKKKHAQLLQDLPQRIAKVNAFIATFRQTFTPLKQDVVQLSDVCGPAGSEADVQALIVTDETIAGADMIKEERTKNGLGLLERYVIGVIGAAGETDVKGDDAAALAASKVGSTAIRGWLVEQGQQDSSSASDKDAAIQAAFGELATKSRGIGESQRPVGANVPPLGLSNRALHSAEEQIVEPPSASGQNLGEATRSVASALSRPPTEDELHSTTLWAEIHKLYGHGLELLALDVCRDGRLIASTCQAKNDEHATVRIHDAADSWKQVAVLEGHSLGVTRVRFSPVNPSLLLSVSRDRTWRLWKRSNGSSSGEKATWALLTTEGKAHARIVWDASWSRDGTTFATCSRDKTAKVWKLSKDTVTLQTSIKLPESCTAIAFAPDNRLALGLESGDLLVYSSDLSADPLTLKEHHTEAVSELSWQPAIEPSESCLLLSASEDGSARLVKLNEV